MISRAARAAALGAARSAPPFMEAAERLQRPALAVYRRMLLLARRLPSTAERGDARTQIRAAFREHRHERNEQR